MKDDQSVYLRLQYTSMQCSQLSIKYNVQMYIQVPGGHFKQFFLPHLITTQHLFSLTLKLSWKIFSQNTYSWYLLLSNCHGSLNLLTWMHLKGAFFLYKIIGLLHSHRLEDSWITVCNCVSMHEYISQEA